MVSAESERVLAALLELHATYFDLDGEPGVDDTTPEPEDVWRYDRDFRAALATHQTPGHPDLLGGERAAGSSSPD